VVNELIERKFSTLSLLLKAQCGFESIESHRTPLNLNTVTNTEPKKKTAMSDSEEQANASSLSITEPLVLS